MWEHTKSAFHKIADAIISGWILCGLVAALLSPPESHTFSKQAIIILFGPVSLGVMMQKNTHGSRFNEEIYFIEPPRNYLI